jgi:predicted phage tail protein
VINVHLHGPIGDKYGHIHAFEITSPREAVKALAANYNGFWRDFHDGGEYFVVIDGAEVSGDEVGAMPASQEIHFVQKIEGSGIETALAGAIAGWLGVSTTVAGIISGVLMTALMIGVSMLLAPKPPKLGRTDQAKDDSYLFSGPENVTEQGVAVPVIYGQVYAGSVVISAGLDTGEEPIDPAPGEGTGGGKSK